MSDLVSTLSRLIVSIVSSGSATVMLAASLMARGVLAALVSAYSTMAGAGAAMRATAVVAAEVFSVHDQLLLVVHFAVGGGLGENMVPGGAELAHGHAVARCHFPYALDVVLRDGPYLGLCQRQDLAGRSGRALLQSRIEPAQIAGAEARALWLHHDEGDGLGLGLGHGSSWGQ